jgi:potassium-transporting ATPase KdpC subunit
MREQILPGFRLTLFMTVALGVIYPLAITGIGQIVFPRQANGGLIFRGGQITGSGLIGQQFTQARYFHPRPSSAGGGYDATASSGSNLGPASAKLLRGTVKTGAANNEVVDFDGIGLRTVRYSLENGIPYESSVPLDRFLNAKGELDDVRLIKAFNDPKAPLRFRAAVPVPADAVTGSASGIDPHISPANAYLQAPRVAAARGVPAGRVKELVTRFTEEAALGILGEPRVNVLRLNLELDR